jgi:hypothetical protein
VASFSLPKKIIGESCVQVLLEYFKKNVKEIDHENRRNRILPLAKPDKALAQAGRERGGVGLAKMTEGRWKMENLIAPLFIQ